MANNLTDRAATGKAAGNTMPGYDSKYGMPESMPAGLRSGAPAGRTPDFLPGQNPGRGPATKDGKGTGPSMAPLAAGTDAAYAQVKGKPTAVPSTEQQFAEKENPVRNRATPWTGT